MSTAQCQKLYELWKKAGLIKGKTSLEWSKASEARVAMLEAKTENSINESFPYKKAKANNRNNPALDRKGSRTRESHADT